MFALSSPIDTHSAIRKVLLAHSACLSLSYPATARRPFLTKCRPWQGRRQHRKRHQPVVIDVVVREGDEGLVPAAVVPVQMEAVREWQHHVQEAFKRHRRTVASSSLTPPAKKPVGGSCLLSPATITYLPASRRG